MFRENGPAEIDVETLRQTREVFRLLADNIREILFVVMPNPPRMAYVNPAYEEVFGRSRQELYRQADAWIDSVEPQSRARVLSAFEQGAVTQVEYRLIRPDGSVRLVHARSFRVQDSVGKLGRVVVIAEDITDSKTAVKQLPVANVAAEVTSQAKIEFLNKIDYEIRTAMNGILGMTELLLNTNMSPEQVEYVQMVRTSTDLLLTNIRNLLKFLV